MNLCIELSDLLLTFQVLDTPIAKLWLERMDQRGQYGLDHPDRFYGFNTPEQDQTNALVMIRTCVDTINSYKQIISRSIDRVDDQDTLNYLHNIFEQYHGLLDSQQQEYWNSAPLHIQQALANLNLLVHRCESVAQGNLPRFVCTWYGLPKTKTLTDELIRNNGVLNYRFGGVYLNYAEIGKTLEDLANDRDNYIGDSAFKPFNHYSADFNVRFYDNDLAEAHTSIEMQKYFDCNLDFFKRHGYTEFNHPRLLPLRFPLAQLVETIPRDQILKEIQERQLITKVYLE